MPRAAGCATLAHLPSHPSAPISSPTGVQLRPVTGPAALTSLDHSRGKEATGPSSPKDLAQAPWPLNLSLGTVSSLFPGTQDPPDMDRNLCVRQGLEEGVGEESHYEEPNIFLV